MLTERLTGIDETNRDQHVYLQAGDRCFFFGEYFAGKGYQGSGTNQLMFNFKCKPSDAAEHPARKLHKDRAVAAIAAGLKRAMTRESVEKLTVVPIPPSKVAGHVDYDDRLMRALLAAFGMELPHLAAAETLAEANAAARKLGYPVRLALDIAGPALPQRVDPFLRVR